jgi:kynurenine formamidase
VHTAKPPVSFEKQIANSDNIVSEFTQAGTQFDALCHFGYIPDGASPHEAVYYNQFTHLEVAGPDGLVPCGVDKLRPYATKAILVDVSRHVFGDQVLPEGTGITVDMTLATLAAQGLTAGDIEPGDVVIFRTGWERNWRITPGSVESTMGYYKGFLGVPGGVPGVTLELAIWLSERRISAVGADNWGIDVRPPVDAPPGVGFPVHNHMLTRGIPMFESLKLEPLADHLAERAATAPPGDKVYEFAFYFAPVRAKGAAGSPASPIAVT